MEAVALAGKRKTPFHPFVLLSELSVRGKERETENDRKGWFVANLLRETILGKYISDRNDSLDTCSFPHY